MAYQYPATIQVFRGTLNSAAINAMNTTAQQVLAAPGAGLINIVLGFFGNAKIGSTPWGGTDFGNIWLVYGTTANDTTNLAAAFQFNRLQNLSASTNYVFGSGMGIGSDWLGTTTGTTQIVTSANSINRAVSITCSNAIGTAGNGSIDYSIFYITLTAA